MSGDPGGYRSDPRGGPRVRTDIIEVYVVRPRDGAHELLQVRRATDPLRGAWHPVMGHAEPGETATDAAFRELAEELGLLRQNAALIEMYALEQVHPYYLAALDCIVMSPRFAVIVAPGWEPTLNDEHDALRWVRLTDATAAFMWPGQKRAVEEIAAEILRPGALSSPHLRVHPTA